MKKQYSLWTKKADFNGLAEKLGVDPLTVRLMVNRGVSEEDMEHFLHPEISDFGDPTLLTDIEKASDIIIAAIKEDKKIRIIGDYDIDGIMSTYILVSAIRRMGGNADFSIPDRVKDGYGLNERLVTDAKADGIDLIITCDNGIAAVDAIKKGKELGLTIVVTDHHVVPFMDDADRTEILPPADAVVNPHRANDRYVFKEICGAVVAWKLVQVLFENAGTEMPDYLDYLENAAFATIGDVMPLVKENRAIVKLGLEKLKHSSNLGMRILIRISEIDSSALNTMHIGYILGPMLNAGGRLRSAEIGVRLLLARDPEEAEKLAGELYELNQERKAQTDRGAEAAMKMAEDYADDRVLVLFVPEVNESVAGIIAGRVRETTGKPVIVLGQGEEYVKGSGRSIPAYSMYEELHKCENLLVKYGGHPLAAGMSLLPENVEALRKALNENCSLEEDDFVEKIHLDSDMPISYLSEELIKEMDNLEPYGNENEKPLFAQRNIPVRRIRRIGKENNMLKFELLNPGKGIMDGLMFRGAEEFEERFKNCFGKEKWDGLIMGRSNGDVALTMVYCPGINVFRGEVSIQIIIQDILF